MKNLKVSMKLIVSFIVVIALAIAVGVVGIIGMSQINAADDALYEGNLLAISYIGRLRAEYNIQRAAVRELAIYPAEHPNFQSALNEIKSSEETTDNLMALYEDTIEHDDDRALFNTFLKAYKEDFSAVKREVTEHGRNNDSLGAMEVLMTKGAAAQQVIRPAFTSCMELNEKMGKESVDNNTSLFMAMTFVEIAVLAFAVMVAMIFAFYISSLISKPLGVLTAFMKKAGSTGDIILSREVQETIGRYGLIKDEVGQCIKYTASFVQHITNISEELESIAGGDLSVDANLLSQQDTMGLSLQKMVGNLNSMFGEINNSTAQVSAGSKQIADGAQALAQGSTQQAAAVEQLSASITEVAGKTKENADMAGKAAHLAQTIKGNAEKGSQQMDTMMSAVKDINEASQSINRVIKVIDDIAFQTNILALNAAVEAARAGQHGKGFAVVAEEVRSLAAKSAEAAKDTGTLIANSMEKAELGARIAGETAASLVDIVSGINESTQIVSEIATSSEQQSHAITQINNGIDQVAQVVQQNSATAEESAAASEEMSGQANMLEELISQFKLKDGNQRMVNPAAAPKRLAMPQKTSYKPDGGSEFGKY